MKAGAALFIGAVLTVVDPAAPYGLEAFRVAELTQVPVWGVGLFMVLRSARVAAAAARLGEAVGGYGCGAGSDLTLSAPGGQ